MDGFLSGSLLVLSFYSRVYILLSNKEIVIEMFL